jgi:hypothetical protein
MRGISLGMNISKGRFQGGYGKGGFTWDQHGLVEIAQMVLEIRAGKDFQGFMYTISEFRRGEGTV